MSWDEFESRRRANPAGKSAEAPAAPDHELIEATFALFNGPLGQKWLEIMRKREVDRRLGPEVSGRALRHFNARRQFVLDIETWVESGRKLLNARTAKPSE